MANKKYISIVDTTLRDGEQTSGVSFSNNEKLIIAQELLTEIGIDRIEVASCRSSSEEQKALKQIMAWAKKNNCQNKIEALSFVDYKDSIDWLLPTGCKRINLLTKGSEIHCRTQLKKTLQQHLKDIEKTLQYAMDKKIYAMVYLEDWSNGILNSPDYVWEMLGQYAKMPFQKIHLPDTLGILSPCQVKAMISETLQRFPDTEFEFHSHNDYGFATANSLEAIKAGISGIHVTVNGLGERAGNASLAEVTAIINDYTEFKTNINEKKLKEISFMVETLSGHRIADNTPIVGDNVFTQVAGIHADGDVKGNLYKSKLAATRFGRDHKYSLGKLSGKSNLDMNLKNLGIELTLQQKKVLLNKIIQLGEQKKIVTVADLPFLISDLFSSAKIKPFKIIECTVTTTIDKRAQASIRVDYKGKKYNSFATGLGGYDAFMNALNKITPTMGIEIPKLLDYEVSIPPGGKTDALVETIITWEDNIRTRAVSGDQVLASIKATERMINFNLKKI